MLLSEQQLPLQQSVALGSLGLNRTCTKFHTTETKPLSNSDRVGRDACVRLGHIGSYSNALITRGCMADDRRVVTANLPSDLISQLEEVAGHIDRSKSWIVRQAVTDWLAEEQRRIELMFDDAKVHR